MYINGIAGTSGKVVACKSGSATIKCTSLSGSHKTLTINDVLLVPEAGVNLIAVSNISKHGESFSGNKEHIKIVNTNQDYVIEGVGANGLYKVKECKLHSIVAAPAIVPADIWNCRFGHLNHRTLSKVTPTSSRTEWCEACTLAKAHCLPSSSHLPQSESPLFRIHSDVVGPMPVPSTGGAKYLVSFIDDATK